LKSNNLYDIPIQLRIWSIRLGYFLCCLFWVNSEVLAQNTSVKKNTDSGQDSLKTKKHSRVEKDTSNWTLEMALTNAVLLYEDGLPDSVLQVLSKENLRKLKIGQANKLQKSEIYRLKALASVLNDDIGSTQKNIKKMLTFQPDYHPREDDLADFLWQMKQMTVVPKTVFGLKVGGNTVTANVQSRYSIFETQGVRYDTRKYSTSSITRIKNTGFSVGGHTEYTLLRRIRLGGEINYSNYSYDYTSNIVTGNFSRSLSYGELSINGKYILPIDFLFQKILAQKNNSWKLYAQYGLFYRFLLTAKESEKDSNSQLGILPWLNRTANGFLWGGGIRKTGKKSWISLEFTQKLSPTNISNPNHRFFNGEGADYIFDFYDISDDINLHSFEVHLNLGFYLNYKVFGKRFRN